MKHKRDSKTYPELTSDRNWDLWNRTVKALARNDHTSQVLDPVYVATSVDEKELFECQQTFMYVVFNFAVLTDVGKTSYTSTSPLSMMPRKSTVTYSITIRSPQWP
jgi:hypothetical protein